MCYSSPSRINCGVPSGWKGKAQFLHWALWLKVCYRGSLYVSYCLLLSGCIEAIEPHLPTLIPYLINTLNDGKVGISCSSSKAFSIRTPSLLYDLLRVGLSVDTQVGARNLFQKSTRILILFPPWKGYDFTDIRRCIFTLL